MGAKDMGAKDFGAAKHLHGARIEPRGAQRET
jgi:hypothetical protein